MTQRWLTVHTKPRAEGLVNIAIEACGWTVFCPFEIVRYIDRGKVCRKPLSLLGPYLFVLMEPEKMTQLDGIDGIDRILRDDRGRPWYGDEEKIEYLRRERNMGRYTNGEGNWAQAGDEVRTSGTALDRFAMKLKNTPRHKRVEMILENSSIRVTAPVDKLEKCVE